MNLSVIAFVMACSTAAYAEPSVPSGSKPDPLTTEQCSAAWNRSPAAQSCTSTEIKVEMSYCMTTANCRAVDGHLEKDLFIYYLPGDAGNIRNCDGWLKLKACQG
ncbi:hypothetical protein [Ralstonia solanacearum]|uniref:hypothetical protein n=1 Tax=Ralstonia solanacearum TaxID=305 RepID=UPI0005080080|nr:hypothetical protein [Ralstonia solanacearum]KFX30745.1 hypothetical protein KR96_00970 [Ralstonia solanacearum]